MDSLVADTRTGQLGSADVSFTPTSHSQLLSPVVDPAFPRGGGGNPPGGGGGGGGANIRFYQIFQKTT